jgi:RHS repeat-associated protein
LGRRKSTTDPKNQTINYTFWYETSQQLTLTDARNNTTNWTYNLRGQILTKVYPNGDDHAYTYDTLGRMATHTTPKNEVCTYTYDLRDRQTLADWNTTTPDTAKTYWANGLIKSIDNGVSKSDYAYNSRNLLTSETQTLSGQAARVVSYTYDADGLRSGMTYPSAQALAYAWTARAQLHTLNVGAPPPLATYTYDKAGRLDTLTHENGIVEDLTHDAASQLSSRIHKLSGNPVSGHGYTLDSTGRRQAETFADGTTPTRDYNYDDADQISTVDYGSSQTDTYNYDAMGNRTTAVFSRSVGVPPTSGTISYGTANSANQYTTVTGLTPISHDSNGNLTQQNGVTYTWDSENRLLSVVPTTPALGDKSLVHTYDGQARRVTRTSREWTATGWTDLEITHFIYDGWNVIEEYHLNTSTTVLVKVLTWGSDLSGSLQGAGGVGGLLMAEEINGTTTTAYHFHYDGNGNVTEITDASGNPAASYRYDAFGNTLVSTGAYAASNRYRFSTKPLDSEVTNAPLYYYGYRYYDPTTGRWPSRDPIGIRGGVNLYRYVENNPVCQIDYLGLVDVNPQQVPDPVKAPVIWVDQPKSQNPGLTQNSGLAICICPDIGPKKGTITCEVTSRSIISLNKAATLKAGET